jgi:hypothetical protein
LSTVHFDPRLKMADVVEKWDGSPDNLADWIHSINILSNRSPEVWNQLGQQIPLRLTGRAKDWFESQTPSYQERIMLNWGTMRDAICGFSMNRPWLDRQKSIANRAKYREQGHPSETPTDYVIRKLKLLNMVYTLSDTEIILEILNGALAYWRTVIDTSSMTKFRHFQKAVHYHEQALTEGPKGEGSVSKRDIDKLWEALKSVQSKDSEQEFVGGTHAVQAPPIYKYPKDDLNVSKKATPKSKGARPCRFCSSDLHWDNECKHYPKNATKVRSHLATATEEELVEQERYELLQAKALDLQQKNKGTILLEILAQLLSRVFREVPVSQRR